MLHYEGMLCLSLLNGSRKFCLINIKSDYPISLAVENVID